VFERQLEFGGSDLQILKRELGLRRIKVFP
jgi:hypothetical protein